MHCLSHYSNIYYVDIFFENIDKVEHTIEIKEGLVIASKQGLGLAMAGG